MQQNSIDTARLLPALRRRLRVVDSLAERELLAQRIEGSRDTTPGVEYRQPRRRA